MALIFSGQLPTISIAENAITNIRLITNDPSLVNITSLYENEVGPIGFQDIQVTSFSGTGLTSTTSGSTFIINVDAKFNAFTNVSANQTTDLVAEHFVFSATKNQITPGQNETNYDGVAPNGFFTSANGHTVGAVITLSDDTTVRVDAIDANGKVTQFTVLTTEISPNYADPFHRHMKDSTGPNVPFTLTPGSTNLLIGGADPNFRSSANTVFFGEGFTGGVRNTNVGSAFWATSITPTDVSEIFNVGTRISKQRLLGTDSLTGTLGERFIQIVELKR